jgi:hypothetical protein
MFGYIPNGDNCIRIFPWDIPALLVYVLFTILIIKKKYHFLPFLIAIGMGFKETTVVLCIAPIFFDDEKHRSLRYRIKSVILLFLISVFVKIGIHQIIQQPNIFSMSVIHPDKHWTILTILVNSGSLLSLFLLPTYDRNILMFKILAFFFLVGNLVCGIPSEYRIWFEMIPFSLYGLEKFVYQNKITWGTGH